MYSKDDISDIVNKYDTLVDVVMKALKNDKSLLGSDIRLFDYIFPSDLNIETTDTGLYCGGYVTEYGEDRYFSFSVPYETKDQLAALLGVEG